MTPEFWIKRWQNNQIGFHRDDVNVHLEDHWDKLGAEPGSCVFVPLCGKSVDMVWLAEHGYGVLGNEISELAVRSFFQENAMTPEISREDRFVRFSAGNITILCGDFFHLVPTDVAECRSVYDRASLIALPQVMRPAYAKHLKCLLPGNVPHLLITLSYDQSEMNGPPFSVDEAEVRAYYAGAYRIERHRSVEILDQEPHFRSKGLSSLIETVYTLR